MNLTLENLKALRGANRVTFQFEATPLGNATTVYATKIHDLGDGYGNVERSVDFEVDSTVVQGNATKPVDGSWTFDDVKSNASVATLFKYLKAGDRIVPLWNVDVDADALADAGLVQDRLDVVVLRDRKNGKQPGAATFTLGNSIVPEGSDDRNIVLSDEAVEVEDEAPVNDDATNEAEADANADEDALATA